LILLIFLVLLVRLRILILLILVLLVLFILLVLVLFLILLLLLLLRFVQFIDEFFDQVAIVGGVLVVRVDLQGLVVMLHRIVPVLDFVFFRFLFCPTHAKRVPKVVFCFSADARFGGGDGIRKSLDRLVVIAVLVSRRPDVELQSFRPLVA